MVKPLILIADDDKAIRLVLERKFNKSGYKTKSTDKGKTLLSWIQQGEGDLIITEKISNRILRLPFYTSIPMTDLKIVIKTLQRFEF